MSKPAWVSDLPGFLDAVDEDFARIYSRLGLGHRLFHPRGVTLLLPAASARKELVKRYDSLRTEEEACSLKDELLGLLISGSVAPEQWAALAKKGYYVNAAGRKVKVEGLSNKGVKLESGAKAELSEVARMFRCTREGPVTAQNYVYEVDKLPPKGETSDEHIGKLLAEPAAQGGADDDAESQIFAKLLKDYYDAKQTSSAAATAVINTFFVKIANALELRKGATVPTAQLAMLFMLRPSSGSDAEDAKSLAAAFMLLTPGAIEKLSLVGHNLAEKLLRKESFDSDPGALIRGIQRARSDLLFSDEGEALDAAKARYQRYVSARNSVMQQVRNARSLTESINIITTAYLELCSSGTLGGKNVLSERATAALKLLQPSPDRLLSFHQLRHDVGALADAEYGDPCVALQYYSVRTGKEISDSVWKCPKGTDHLSSVQEGMAAAVQSFAASGLLDLEAQEPSISGGASVPVSGGMVDSIRAWVTFGGGDVGELMEQLRIGGCPMSSGDSPIDSQ